MERLMPLIGKEVQQERWKAAIILAIFVLTAVSIPAMYGYLQEMLTGVPIPQELQHLIDQQLADYSLYLWGNWSAKNLYQFLVVGGLILGAGTVSGEVARGNHAWLFALPVSRRQVVLAKWLASMLIIASAAVAGTLALDAASRVIEGAAAPSTVYIALLPGLVGASFVVGVAVFFSVIIDDPIRAGLTAAVVLAALSLPGWFEDWHMYSVYVHMTGRSLITEGALDWLPVLITATASAGVLWLAVQRMEARDI